MTSGLGEAKLYCGYIELHALPYDLMFHAKFQIDARRPLEENENLFAVFIECRDVTILTHVNLPCDLMFHARFQLNILSGSEVENLWRPY